MTNKAFETFKAVTKKEVNKAVNALDIENYTAAAQMILDSEAQGGRLHITGIGKPSYVAQYGASLISSTGTPTYYLHGTEAVHGSCGQLREGDVVIYISNSGETSELKATAIAARNNGAKLIGITGNPESWLAKYADLHITAHVDNEGGPLNRAPRTSILSETLVVQALSVILQATKEQTPQQYVKCHPGGSLGSLRENEK